MIINKGKIVIEGNDKWRIGKVSITMDIKGKVPRKQDHMCNIYIFEFMMNKSRK